mmetsp:Transcript_40356/g.87969  ORF Transcript_40356/g.87969 Transcript_40356/m.87969 type:complete len:296 (-) Transcript_40356:1260-2147(-)
MASNLQSQPHNSTVTSKLNQPSNPQSEHMQKLSNTPSVLVNNSNQFEKTLMIDVSEDLDMSRDIQSKELNLKDNTELDKQREREREREREKESVRALDTLKETHTRDKEKEKEIIVSNKELREFSKDKEREKDTEEGKLDSFKRKKEPISIIKPDDVMKKTRSASVSLEEKKPKSRETRDPQPLKDPQTLKDHKDHKEFKEFKDPNDSHSQTVAHIHSHSLSNHTSISGLGQDRTQHQHHQHHHSRTTTPSTSTQIDVLSVPTRNLFKTKYNVDNDFIESLVNMNESEIKINLLP